MHRVAAGRYRLSIEFGRRGVFEPEQEARQGRRLVLGDAVVLVRDGQREKGVEVALSLGDPDRAWSPGGDDRTNADVVEHAGDDLDWGPGDRLLAQSGNARDDRVLALSPAVIVLPGVQPAQPVGEPEFRLLAPAEGPNLGRREGVRRIVEPTQASPRQAHLGRVEKTGDRHLHRHASIAQRVRDGLDVVVGRGEHRDVAVAHRTRLARLAVAHGAFRLDEVRDRARQRVGLLGRLALGKGPAHHRRGAGSG